MVVTKTTRAFDSMPQGLTTVHCISGFLTDCTPKVPRAFLRNVARASFRQTPQTPTVPLFIYCAKHTINPCFYCLSCFLSATIDTTITRTLWLLPVQRLHSLLTAGLTEIHTRVNERMTTRLYFVLLNHLR